MPVKDVKARRDRLLAKGKCPKHVIRDLAPGRKRCQECLDKGTARATRLNTSRKASGFCPSHPLVPAAPGKTMCGECLVKKTTAESKRTVDRLANGKCPKHPLSDVTPGFKCCADCLVAKRERQKRRLKKKVQAGLCISCSAPRTGPRYCDTHRLWAKLAHDIKWFLRGRGGDKARESYRKFPWVRSRNIRHPDGPAVSARYGLDQSWKRARQMEHRSHTTQN